MSLTHRPPHRITSAVLASRLNTGERMIDAETDPNKRQQLEDFWLDLLRQYEVAVDAEREHQQEVLVSV